MEYGPPWEAGARNSLTIPYGFCTISFQFVACFARLPGMPGRVFVDVIPTTLVSPVTQKKIDPAEASQDERRTQRIDNEGSFNPNIACTRAC